MQAISLNPQRQRIISKQIILAVLAVLAACVPALGLPLALLMPLFSCPLIGGKEQWTAYVTAPLPAVFALLHHMPPVYAAGLLLVAAAPVAATAILGKKRTGTPMVFPLYSFLVAVACGIALLGLVPDPTTQGLPQLLADRVEAFVMKHPQRTQFLYQAMSTGLLPVPKGYTHVTLLNLMLDPVFLSELRLSLNSLVLRQAESNLLSLYVNVCIVLGLFTGLRVQRLRNAYLLVDKSSPEKIRVAMTPGFSMLTIPAGWHMVMAAFLLVYLLCLGAEGYLNILSRLMYHTFETVYQLQGAAVVCSWFMHKDPDKRTLGGIVAAVLYVLAPFALFVMGCFEHMFPFRSRTEDDNEEPDNHKEEKP